MSKRSSLVRELFAGRQLLIFDFDGTLADTSPLHARAFAETLAPHGIDFDYARIAGLRTADALAVTLRAAGRSTDAAFIAELERLKQSRVREIIPSEIAVLPGAMQFLRWARDRFRLAICTGGSRRTISLSLQSLGLDGWFEPVMCGDDVLRGKPDPEGFLRCLAIAGVAPVHALVFEDSPAGLAAAAGAGCARIHVHGPDVPKSSDDEDSWTWPDLMAAVR